MIASSPPSPAPPPPSGSWWTDATPSAFRTDFTAVVIALLCFTSAAISLVSATRVLLRCLERRRAAREVRDEEEPKPPSDGAVESAGASPVVAAVWAEAECAICLSELELEEGSERVRVLPACGHGFHAACVEGWLATRASCPTCRAPSRPGRRGGKSRSSH